GPRAERAAEQGDRDDEAGDRGVEVELALDRGDRTVDDRAVEAEEEAADGGGDREADGLPVRAAFGRLTCGPAARHVALRSVPEPGGPFRHCRSGRFARRVERGRACAAPG